MAKSLASKEMSHPLLKTLGQIGGVFAGGVKPWIHELWEELEGRLDQTTRLLEKRLAAAALRGAAFFISVLFLAFGILFMVIDYGGVPRGIACLACGLLGLVLLALWGQFAQ